VLWLLICLVGLVAETSFIVVMGRQVTGDDEDPPTGEQDARIRRRSRP
jgi:hypothetical protein